MVAACPSQVAVICLPATTLSRSSTVPFISLRLSHLPPAMTPSIISIDAPCSCMLGLVSRLCISTSASAMPLPACTRLMSMLSCALSSPHNPSCMIFVKSPAKTTFTCIIEPSAVISGTSRLVCSISKLYHLPFFSVARMVSLSKNKLLCFAVNLCKSVLGTTARSRRSNSAWKVPSLSGNG